MPKKKQILYPVFFMILVTVVFTLALATINEITIDRIEDLESLKTKQSILYAAGVLLPEEAIPDYYEANVTALATDRGEIFRVSETGGVSAYIYRFTGSGLWGSITGYLALDADFNTLLGLDFVSHSETPGLGGRISESWYKEQFRGIEFDPQEDAYIIYTPSPGGNVDAISGATGTSEAVRNILNKSMAEFISILMEVI